MKHNLIKTGDNDSFPQIQDRNGEVVLSYCRVCKKGEAELDEECNPTFTASPEVIQWLKDNPDVPDKELATRWIDHIRSKRRA